MDEQLQALIDKVCRYEEATPERQKALNKFLVIIQQLPGIKKSSHQDYLEALNKTWEWVCRSIDKFEPNPNQSIEDSLVKWINGYLIWRIKDLYIPDSKYDPKSLDEKIGNGEDSKTNLGDILPDTQDGSSALDLLDKKIEQIEKIDRRSWGQRVIQFIEEDEKQVLSRCHPRVNAECNCQLLAKRLLLANPPHKIAHIAREYSVSKQTLYSHWKKKCLPLLKEIGVNLRVD